MTLLVPNAAEVMALKAFLNHTAQGQNQVLRLFTNDKTPAEGDAAVSYTEASGSGYVAKNLTGASWSIATSGSTTTGQYAQQTYTFTGALGNVYGYYITRASTGELLWAERFTSAPFNVQNSGDQIKVTPKITLD